MNTEHILKVVSIYFPNFLQEWEINLIIDDCLKNAQNDNDILHIIDDYLAGIENSV